MITTISGRQTMTLNSGGLDDPSAPPPDVAGWVVWDMYGEMDADGDGFIDEAWDDPFQSITFVGIW